MKGFTYSSRRGGIRTWRVCLRRFFLVLVSFLHGAAPAFAAEAAGKVRTYYVAADEIDWNYAPSGRDAMHGHPLHLTAVYSKSGSREISTIFRKAVYREYTDATFKTLTPRPDKWKHLGLLGPVIRAEVGDTIRIVFRNNGSHPYSIHAHGVFYDKDSEGSPYEDGTSGKDKADDAVAPGTEHVYVWRVPERAGPGPKGPKFGDVGLSLAYRRDPGRKRGPDRYDGDNRTWNVATRRHPQRCRPRIRDLVRRVS